MNLAVLESISYWGHIDYNSTYKGVLMNIKEIFILFLINLLTLSSCYNNEIYQNNKIDITSSPIISQSSVNSFSPTITPIQL